MATNIFLGNPPENIKQFIKKHYGPKDMTNVPLHFTAEQDGSTVSLLCYDDYETWDICDSWCEFEYSMTGKDDDWQTYETGLVIDLNKDETVYFRCPREKDDSLNQNKNGFCQYEDWGDGYYELRKYHVFEMEGSIKADGNIQFLLENTGTMMEAPVYCYSKLFKSCTSLTQAPSILPATTLACKCYANMFYYCTALTKAPKLPAITLADWCYSSMFEYCTSLTQAPDLPAETLAYGCYGSMFWHCSSLTKAPGLPATTLANACYRHMFRDCTSLTQAPELPATTLAEGCYSCMFEDCKALNNVNVSFLTWETSDATDSWLDGVAAEGTFTCPTDLPDTPRDESHIPEGWTRVDKQ